MTTAVSAEASHHKGALMAVDSLCLYMVPATCVKALLLMQAKPAPDSEKATFAEALRHLQATVATKTLLHKDSLLKMSYIRTPHCLLTADLNLP